MYDLALNQKYTTDYKNSYTAVLNETHKTDNDKIILHGSETDMSVKHDRPTSAVPLLWSRF